jgi:integrase
VAARRKQTRSEVRVAEGIYRRPSGKYVVPIYDPVSRKKIRKWPGVPVGGFATIDEAKTFKRRMESEKQTRGSSRETAGSFAKRWATDYPDRRGASTQVHNAERVKSFERDFKEVPMADISRKMARLWVLGGQAPGDLEQIARGWKGVKVEAGRVVVPAHRSNLKVVRSMFSDAVRDGVAAENPFARMGVEEGKGRSEIVVLTGDEVSRVTRIAERTWGEYGETVYGPMIVVAAYTGMRPGELYALRWSRIDFEADELHIRRQWQQKTGKEALPKHEKERTITLLPQARAALQKLASVRRTDHDLVFWIQSGARFHQRAAHYYWNPVRTAFWTGLDEQRQDEIPPDFAFYELRHFYGTHLAMDWNLSPYEIADQMGHADGGILAARRYIHPVSRDVRSRLRDRIRDAQMLGEAAAEREAS